MSQGYDGGPLVSTFLPNLKLKKCVSDRFETTCVDQTRPFHLLRSVSSVAYHPMDNVPSSFIKKISYLENSSPCFFALQTFCIERYTRNAATHRLLQLVAHPILTSNYFLENPNRSIVDLCMYVRFCDQNSSASQDSLAPSKHDLDRWHLPLSTPWMV